MGYAFSMPEVRHPSSVSGGSACPVPAHQLTGVGNIIFRCSTALGRIIQAQAIRLRKEGPGQAKPEKSGFVMALYLYEMPQARCEARLRM
jgi:hypothetical protein